MSKKHVSYFYDEEVGGYYYGQGHPMKPHRIRMAHNLILNYGVYQLMEIYRPFRATEQDMERFHRQEYIDFLKHVTPDNISQYADVVEKFHVGEECPPFDGVFEFSRISCGGSIGGAVKLNQHQCDIAINWAGGLHHAKKSEASGFCYVNDIVLGILELLKRHPRVLYLDIDIHHGDGVEEAFYATDRVITCSFHKYGNYFPGTGHIRDIGAGIGRGYAVNVPLSDGIDDESFQFIFKPVMQRVMDVYRPSAIVVQCGGDSLSGDRLGCFNLSIECHAECVRFMKSFDLPTLVLGGGGYTVRNVSRCWAFETGVCLDVNMATDLPPNDYMDYFGPTYKLQIATSTITNTNSRPKLERIREEIFENLRGIQPAPGVQMHETPGDLYSFEVTDEDANADERATDAARESNPSRNLQDDGYSSIYLPEPFVEQSPKAVGASMDLYEVPETYSNPEHYGRSSVPIH